MSEINSSNYFHQQERNKNKNIITPTFYDWDEFLCQCERPANRQQASGVGDLAVNEAVALARKGWPEGREWMLKFRGMLDSIIAGGGYQLEHRYTEAGDEVDVGRFLGGEPENMTEYVPREYTGGRGGRIVKLLVNVTSSYSITSDSAYLRGALAMAFSDALEQYGYRVEMWVGELGINGDGDNGKVSNIFIRSLIKRAGEHFNVDRLAFAVCHDTVQRSLFFRIYNQQPLSLWNMAKSSYGMGGDFEDPDPEVIEFGCLWHRDQGGYLDSSNIHEHFAKGMRKFGLEMSQLA